MHFCSTRLTYHMRWKRSFRIRFEQIQKYLSAVDWNFRQVWRKLVRFFCFFFFIYCTFWKNIGLSFSEWNCWKMLCGALKIFKNCRWFLFRFEFRQKTDPSLANVLSNHTLDVGTLVVPPISCFVYSECAPGSLLSLVLVLFFPTSQQTQFVNLVESRRILLNFRYK